MSRPPPLTESQTFEKLLARRLTLGVRFRAETDAMTMAFADKSLTCRECGNAFVWTAGEQEFYQQKGLLHEPQRCPDCRKKAKAERAAARAANMHDVICSNCGKPAQVPFEPRTDRPVYCSECFEARRSAPPPAAPPPA